MKWDVIVQPSTSLARFAKDLDAILEKRVIVKNNCNRERPLTIPSFKLLAVLATTGSAPLVLVWCITSCIEATNKVQNRVNHEVHPSVKQSLKQCLSTSLEHDYQ